MKTTSSFLDISPSVENPSNDSVELEHGILEGFIVDSEDDDYTSLSDINFQW